MGGKLTVLHLVNSLQWGGVRKHVLDLQRGSAEHNVRSIIAAWLPPSDPLTGGPDVFALPLYDADGARKSIPGFLESLRRLRELIRSEHVLLLHMHSRYATLLGSLASRGSDVRRLYTAHNVFEDLRWLPWYPSDIIAPAPAVKEHFLSRTSGAEKFVVRVIRHGVAIPELPPQDEHRPPRFCFAGRLCEEKGVRVLFEALLRIRDSRGTVPTVDIIGDGPLLPWLQAQVETHTTELPVHLHGYVSEVAPILSRATALVFPSLQLDSLGYVNIEAMALGVPVIASDLPVLRDLVLPGETGMLVRPGDPSALAAAMMTAMDSVGEMHRLGVSARAMVRERHSLTLMCEETAQAYRDILRP
jgi:glycosyltransferase involved in cell wall biosynthesis